MSKEITYSAYEGAVNIGQNTSNYPALKSFFPCNSLITDTAGIKDGIEDIISGARYTKERGTLNSITLITNGVDIGAGSGRSLEPDFPVFDDVTSGTGIFIYTFKNSSSAPFVLGYGDEVIGSSPYAGIFDAAGNTVQGAVDDANDAVITNSDDSVACCIIFAATIGAASHKAIYANTSSVETVQTINASTTIQPLVWGNNNFVGYFCQAYSIAMLNTSEMPSDNFLRAAALWTAKEHSEGNKTIYPGFLGMA